MTKILGVRIDNLDKKRVLEKAEEFISFPGRHYIVTPNPEIILAARDDEELFYILNNADLALADGIGLKFAGLVLGKNIRKITGADIAEEILSLAERKKIKVGILDWKDGFSSKKEIENSLERKYPSLDFMVEKIGRSKDSLVSGDFLDFAPRVLFVSLGFPHQEKFIYHNLEKIPSVRLAMGIGGTFDYFTGRKRRAPKILRIFGLEWFWRLILQPNRIKRIYNAVFYFSYRFLWDKFYCSFFYRPNVVCLLYKLVPGRDRGKEGDKYKILVVERREEPGHWQLPQGGTGGEPLLVAGKRELREETNCAKFKPKACFKNIHKYKFGTRPGEDSCRADSCRKYTGFKGQKQSLFIAEFTGSDSDIKVNFWDHTAWKWVDSEKLIDSVHIIRKRATQRFLKKFNEFIGRK